MDNIKCDIPWVLRQRPTIKSWSLDLLRLRLETEMESGGLGMGEMEEPYQQTLEVNRGVENVINDVPPSSPSDIEVHQTTFFTYDLTNTKTQSSYIFK